MTTKVEKPRLESASFWEMATLAMSGKLASCQSCVEFYYFQSHQNALAFLDSCAAGGLVEKVSLLDLHGDLEPSRGTEMTLRQQWYDQSIYISAPIFRKQNLDAARKKIEGTTNAVYSAFRLYYERLQANDVAINAAYLEAMKKGILRDPDLAKRRADVDLSPVAKLRLIQDGFRCSLKKRLKEQNRKPLPSEIERGATEATVTYVSGFLNVDPRGAEVRDHAEELEKFIEQFLSGQPTVEDFWDEQDGEMPSEPHLQPLPVISELIRQRLTVLNNAGRFADADDFKKLVLDKITQALRHSPDGDTYRVALAEVIEDLAVHSADLQASLSVIPAEASGERIRVTS